MSQKSLFQGLAIGLFIATSVFSAVYFFSSNGNSQEDLHSVEDAIALLEDEGYSILKEEELVQLHDEIEQLERIIEESYSEETDESDDKENIEENIKEEEEEKVEKEEVEKEKEEKEVVKEFILNIEAGMHSRNIGEILKKYDIVEDERDFEQYVLELGVDRDIRMGEYELSSDMSVDEIIEIITNP